MRSVRRRHRNAPTKTGWSAGEYCPEAMIVDPSHSEDPTQPDAGYVMSEPALLVRNLSTEMWGEAKAVEIVGLSPVFVEVLKKVEKAARYSEPVLITGESGVGKELLAQSIYLLSELRGRPYISVNCPQYREGNLTASELFGHRRGSFTSAIADHKGAFETADGGLIFLDEIGDLDLSAQAMMLRAIATGEFKPVGEQQYRTVNVRVVAATNRPLNKLVNAKEFRNDLYFRLRYFPIEVPPLRERGDDWRLHLYYVLNILRRKHNVRKQFSPNSLRLLESCHWPGNVRQLIGAVTMGFAMASGDTIHPSDFASQLEGEEIPGPKARDTMFEQMTTGGESFWDVVYRPYMARDLNRSQVKSLLRQALMVARGNYRHMLDILHLPSSDYQKLMDFLRHHDLKP